ncbi:hypothetical protein [Haloarcula montana]|uniref:hypothetical protein n=1 Tax=Haloarcula montana TaxID=3111776 RepID=UPI002D765B10|nr:hypothetical protein [Haloarcula sp. GH36]
MAPTRRSVLRSLAGLTSAAAVGTGQAAAQETETDEEDPATRLATRTDRIMDGLSWFAEEYPAAISAYREAAADVLDAVREQGESVPLTERDVARLDREIRSPRIDIGWPYDVWWSEDERLWRYVPIDWRRPQPATAGATPLDGDAIQALRSVTTAFADTYERELGEYFRGAERERRFGRSTLDSIERFNERGDAVMVVAGLVRLYRHYEAVASERFVDSTLSRDPIRSALAETFVADSPEQIPLFEIDYRRAGFRDTTHRAVVYSDDIAETRVQELYRAQPVSTIDGAAVANDSVRLQEVTKPLSVDSDRIDRCYVVVNEWTRPAAGYYSSDLPSQPLFVQRYTSAEAAQVARETILSRSGISRAGGVTVRLGGADSEPWTPFYYPYQSELWSGAFRRVGPHLLVAGVARRPFVHRADGWEEPLALSWVWDGESG